MIRILCTVMGVLFCLVGIAGFPMPTMLDMHLSTAHNVLHLGTGILAVYFGTRSETSARRFAQIFGVIYLLVGIIGVVSPPGIFTLHHVSAGMPDDHLLKLVPTHLEFGTADSAMHILLGALLAITGFVPAKIEAKADRSVERVKENAGAKR